MTAASEDRTSRRERIARALYNEDYPGAFWDSAHYQHKHYRRLADVVLAVDDPAPASAPARPCYRAHYDHPHWVVLSPHTGKSIFICDAEGDAEFQAHHLNAARDAALREALAQVHESASEGSWHQEATAARGQIVHRLCALLPADEGRA